MKPLPATGPKLIGINAFASVERRIDREVLSIGAADSNDLVLAHKSVSGRHAEIRRMRDGCIVRDLGSTNGTYVNGKRIEGEQVLRPGDELRFGAARFALVAGQKSSSSIARIIGPALGLMMLAALGFLSIRFVRNWDNLEQLPSPS
ncbi:MAG TPA: FHA domain-containing protein, partial [Candidatus Binataceae bacterium]|nr:FHA domain-containing protein [Candidatus Binataceae bacterium]